VVLFIAADDGKMLSGDKINTVLPKYQLSFGDMDLFHYPIEDNGVPSKLFSIANGVSPWTLNPDDLALNIPTNGSISSVLVKLARLIIKSPQKIIITAAKAKVSD